MSNNVVPNREANPILYISHGLVIFVTFGFFGLRIDGLSRNIKKNRHHASHGDTCGSVEMMIGPILIGNRRRLVATI
jgi:hypothetical protein